jgi:hypothetical protein
MVFLSNERSAQIRLPLPREIFSFVLLPWWEEEVEEGE